MFLRLFVVPEMEVSLKKILSRWYIYIVILPTNSLRGYIGVTLWSVGRAVRCIFSCLEHNSRTIQDIDLKL